MSERVLPAAFTARMRRLLRDDYARLEEWFEKPVLQRGLRVNTLKCTAEKLEQCLPFTLQATPFSKDGCVTTASFRAGSEPLHHAGAYYMQEPSAMSAVTVLSPKKGERVLDLCAAPGGKSTQIAAALDGSGLLWANEYVPVRAKVLAQNLERCGVKNGVVSCGDTARVAQALPEWFDAVLADVPCSGEGMFRKEEAAVTEWSEEAVSRCAERSAEILDNAATCVRQGGRLVLSTCTFAPEENEIAVIRFLQRHPDFWLEETDVLFGQAAFDYETIEPFIPTSLQDFAKTVDTRKCRRIFPWHGGEGHFIAKFRRQGESDINAGSIKQDKNEAIDLARKLYEECFITPPDGVFSVFGDTVRLLPKEFPAVSGVTVLSAGVAVAKVCKGRLLRAESCHAVFQAAKAEDCRRLLDFDRNDPQLLEFLRGEEIAVNAPNGYTAVAVCGVVTGFGKVSNGKLKNHYPKGLRLLR